MTQRLRGSSAPLGVLFAAFLLLSFYLSSPLMRALAWSAVLSYFAFPAYCYIRERLFGGRFENLAATLTTGLILVFMALPFSGAVIALSREAIHLYGIVAGWSASGNSAGGAWLHAWIARTPLLSEIADHLFRVGLDGGVLLEDAGRRLAGFLADLSRGLLENAFRMFFNLVVITVSSFFFLRDGRVILTFVNDLIPLPQRERNALFRRAQRMLRAVVYGIMFTAGVQATLGGLGWWVVGLPNPLFFGSLMFVTGMIPFVGTPVVWLPGSLWLLASGEMKQGLFLLAWGGGVVSTVDNFIRPIFISEGSKVPVLLVFMGVIGGLATFGFLGLFLGPLILSLTLFLLDTYRRIVAIRAEGERQAPAGDKVMELPPGDARKGCATGAPGCGGDVSGKEGVP